MTNKRIANPSLDEAWKAPSSTALQGPREHTLSRSDRSCFMIFIISWSALNNPGVQRPVRGRRRTANVFLADALFSFLNIFRQSTVQTHSDTFLCFLHSTDALLEYQSTIHLLLRLRRNLCDWAQTLRLNNQQQIQEQRDAFQRVSLTAPRF